MSCRRLHRLWMLVLLCAVLASPRGLRAYTEDAGLRSVFALGAGNRALALGGAYAARADDASVLFWNPGALGMLSRQEFQAGHSSFYGLGFNEQYASLVLPNWRWGVAALGYRHFGVGGIEERDPRNVLLSEDLTSDEHQLSMAYGKAFGEAWSLGGSLKLWRQELAGLAGSGIGLDLGVLLRPAVLLGRQESWIQPLSLGLSMRNAVEPSLRLDRDSVTDPTSLRLGFGYEYFLGPGRGLLPVLDLEKVGGMDLRVRAGLELVLQPLALRFGYGDERLSTGAGIAWRDFGFDYVYEDNPIEDLHRFSVSANFGASVEESRQAALHKQDEALQARLVAAFRQRQSERIDELLRQAEEARGRGEYDTALETLGTLRALEPEHEQVAGLMARCFCEQAEYLAGDGDFTAAALAFRRALVLMPDEPAVLTGLEYCESESNRRAARSQELRRQFAAALDAFGADRLVEARQGFRAILDAQAGDEDAASMLHRTEQAIRQRTATLLEQAERFAGRGFLREARDFLAQAEQLDAEAKGIPRVRILLARAEERQTGPAGQGVASPGRTRATALASGGLAARSLSRKEREEIADLYRRGNAAAQAGRSDDALRYWELVWSTQPGYQQVDEYLKREYLMRGMEVFAAGRLEEAANLWEKALRVDPNDERAMGYLARAEEQLARTREILNE